MARHKANPATRAAADAAPPPAAARAPVATPARAPAAAAVAGRGTRFWFGMVLFQLAFGFSVFVLTRAHYDRPSAVAAGQATPTLAAQPGMAAPPGMPTPRAADDAAALGDDALRQRAGAAFTRGEYLAAAGDYTVLVTRQPRDVEMLNNLAISLHFAGRSAEGLARIREGLALQPGHQRSLLTLGFIQRALGETDAARAALQRAIDADPASGVGLEAARLLGEL